MGAKRMVVARPRSSAKVGPAQRAHLEHKADVAAQRILRGDTSVAADVGSTIAAAAPAFVTGAGTPLPCDLRTRLERGFGAELGAVRLHRDADAARAATDHGALAFTAGAHVYWGNRAPAVDSEAGVRLLAHELAHALQQARTIGANGRPRVVDRFDMGEVQCVDLVDRADELFDETPDFSAIVTAYKIQQAVAQDATDRLAGKKGAQPTDVDLGKLSTSTVDNFVMVAEELAIGADIELTSFLIDCLKALERHVAAETLLVQAKHLATTTFRSRTFYKDVRARGLGWMPDVASRAAFPKRFYRKSVLETYRTLLFSPGAPFPEMGKNGASVDAEMEIEWARLKDEPKRKTNELVTLSTVALWSLDVFRIALQKKWLKEHAKLEPAHARKSIAELIVGAPATEHFGFTTVPEVIALHEAMWPDIVEIANGALTLWKRAFKASTSIRDGGDFEKMTAAELVTFAHGIKDQKAFAGLEAAYVKLAKRVIEEDGAVTSDSYAGRIEEQREVARKLLAKYGESLAAHARKGKLDTNEALANALVVDALSETLVRLRDDYSESRDIALGENWDDERLAARIKLAKHVVAIEKRFGFHGITAIVAPLRSRSRVALFADWPPPRPGGLRDYSRDFPGEQSGLTATGISNLRIEHFFVGWYLDLVIAKLAELQQGQGVKGTSLVKAVQESMVNFARPRRSVNEKFVYWFDEAAAMRPVPGGKATDLEIDPSKGFHQTVFAHPRTVDFLGKHKYPGMEAVSRVVPPRKGGLSIWLLPDMDPFATRLLRIKEIREVLEKRTATVPQSWHELRPLLVAWAEEARASGDVKKQIADPVSRDLDEDWTTSKTRAILAARLATVEQVSYRFRHFERVDWSTHEHAFAAFDQIYELDQFVRQFDDTTEQLEAPVQVALLILEVADEMNAAISPKLLGRRYDLVGTALQLLAGTMKMWNRHRPALLSARKPSMPESELQRRANQIQRLEGALHAAIVEIQMSRGVYGYTDANDGHLMLEGFSAKLAREQSFEWDGYQNTLVRVYRDFVWYPAFEQRNTMGIKWPGGGRDVGAGMLLDPFTWTPLKRDSTPLVRFQRRRFKFDKKLRVIPLKPDWTWEINADQTDQLDTLYEHLGNSTGVEMLNVTGRALEKIVKTITEVIEFIPGIGQGVMAIRFAVTVLDMITDPDVRQIIDAIGENGIGAFTEHFTKIQSLFVPERLVEYFLFHEPPGKFSKMFPFPMKDRTPEQEYVVTRTGIWGKVARAAQNVLEIGVRVLESAQRVRGFAQSPIRYAQTYVTSRPMVNRFVGLVADNIDRLTSIGLEDLAPSADDLVDSVWQKDATTLLTDGAQQILAQVANAVGALKVFNLPNDVFPLPEFAELIVDLVIGRLGGKYKVAFRGAEALLKKIGLWEKFKDKLGEALGKFADPNSLYRSLVIKHVQPQLTSVRNKAIDGIFQVAATFPIIGDKLKAPTKPAVDIGFDADEFSGPGDEAEMAPYPGDGFDVAAPIDAPVARGGEALASPIRERAEGSLGQDLGHVRVHRDSEAARVTRSSGADALTSGSHIYLDPALSPTTGHGEHVLRHELGHVVQQSGPRPLCEANDETPITGTPGRGLVFDAQREAAADAAASAMGDRRVVAVAPGTHRGIQPYWETKLAKELLTNLRKEEALKGEGNVEQSKSADAQRALELDNENSSIAEKLAGKFFDALDKLVPSEKTIAAPFHLEKDALVELARDQEADLKRAMPVVVNRVPVSMVKRRDGKGKGKARWVEPKLLERELVRQIFAETGFAVSFNLATTPSDVHFKLSVNVNATGPVLFDELKVAYVHLPLLDDPTDRLWTKAVINTFKDGRISGSLFDGSDDMVKNYVRVARIVLSRLRIDLGLYERRNFRFSRSAAAGIESIVKMVYLYETEPFPTPAQYLQPTTRGLKKLGLERKGLRVGRYKDFAIEDHLNNDPRYDRDPHHVVQFLLLQYLSNDHALKPFPLRKTLPDEHDKLGFAGSGETVHTLKSPSGTINVNLHYVSEDDRGPEMPVILLSKHAHRSAIHLPRESPDETRDTQGKTVDMEFRRNLVASATALGWLSYADGIKRLAAASSDSTKVRDERTTKELESARLDKPLTPMSRDALATMVWTAARKTYAYVWDHMRTAMESDTPRREQEYYAAIVAKRGKNEPGIEQGQVSAAIKKVVKLNNDELGTKAGFA